MSPPETFDAFYARTAWNVTSQMHSVTGQDSAADHAVREAYAKAYQQWYEVSGYRDAEAWVLKVAEDAYERRRAQGAAAGLSPDAAAHTDSSTWPGIYRPRSAGKQATAGLDPGAEAPDQAQDGLAMVGDAIGGSALADGGLARGGANGVALDAAGSAGSATALAAGSVPAGAAAPPAGAALAESAAGLYEPTGSTSFGGSGAPGTTMDRPMPDSGATRSVGAARGWTRWPGRAGLGRRAAPAGGSGVSGPGRLGGVSIPAGLASRRMLVAGIAAVVAVGVVAYLAFGGQQPVKSASRGPGGGARVKPAVHMLPAGRTDGRASVPWSVVGQGWTLAEVSAASPDANGSAAAPGRLSLYLVDPVGGKYLMRRWNGASVTLLAWSGDARHALLGVSTAAPAAPRPTYSLLSLANGRAVSLPLKSNITPVGFTRPDGLNILAIRRTADKYQLRRYDLRGAPQGTLSTMPDRQPAPVSQAGSCPSLCNALSSPDGVTAVWGIAGNEMQLVNNAGGLIRRLRVPSSGTPPSCLPVSWWNAGTILANCAAPGQPNAHSERLWLVPANGTAATPLAPGSGSPSGAGFDAGAWTAGGHVYLTRTSGARCSTAASGPGGLGILSVGQGGSLTTVTISGSTNNYDNVVASVGSRLLVLAQTSCQGTSSLFWYSPAARTTKGLLAAPAGEAGVIAAVPYRGWPVAYSLGTT